MPGRKILMIDDDPDHLILCKHILEKAGFTVTSMAAFSAIQRLDDEISLIKPDLIYVDYEMPGFNGAEIIEHLRRADSTSKIPTIYFSGHADIPDLAQQHGADGHIRKPFDVDQLLAVTQKYLDPPIE